LEISLCGNFREKAAREEQHQNEGFFHRFFSPKVKAENSPMQDRNNRKA
jgi:hypothetical protein